MQQELKTERDQYNSVWRILEYNEQKHKRYSLCADFTIVEEFEAKRKK